MNNESLYIIRYPLVPEEPRQKRIDLLLQFCDEAKIDEVMFFVMPEEYNRGQWRASDYRPWLDIAVQAKAMVEKRGLRTSLNLWHTLLHCDRGRRSEDLSYRRMVLDTGEVCLSVACPICEQWQDIFFKTFQEWAKAGFKQIWLEDDYRFHNHSVSPSWGGCFCDTHILRLIERGVRAQTRQELVGNINPANTVHPDRKIWMDFNAATYIDLARTMRARMDAVDPAIKLGLMTSFIPVHAIEGRDWTGLINALGGPERAMVRPHACGYSESCQKDFFVMFGNLAQTRNVLPKGTKTFFEIENGPMSRFSKSNHQTRAQMACVTDGGCDGMTFDVLDFLGTGPASEPDMAATMAGVKDKLQTMRAAVAGKEAVGVRAILPLDTCALAPGNGGPIGKLPTINYGWFIFLGGFGYPCINQPETSAVDPAGVYAISGDSAWGIPERTLRNLLENGVTLLDADAARILVDRKLGNQIGINNFSRYTRDENTHSYEEAVNQPSDQIPQRASLNMSTDIVHMYELTGAARPRTVVKDCFNRIMGTGSFTFQNGTGRGLVLPFNFAPRFLAHNWTRKHWIDRWLDELCGGVTVPHLLNGTWVYLSARSGPTGKTLFLANQTFDVYSRLELRLPEDFRRSTWTIEAHSRNTSAAVSIRDDRMTIETELVGNDWVFLSGK